MPKFQKGAKMATTGPAISAGPRIASSRGGAPLGGRIESGGISPQRACSFDTPRSANFRSFLKGFVPVSRASQIGFEPTVSQAFDSVRPLGKLPSNISEIGYDSGPVAQNKSPKPKQSVTFLGILPNIPEAGSDPAQPQVVTETIHYSKPVTELVSEIAVNIQNIQPATSEVEPQNEANPIEVRSEVAAKVQSVSKGEIIFPKTKPIIEAMKAPEIKAPDQLMYQMATRLRARFNRLTRPQVGTAPTVETAPVTETQSKTTLAEKVETRTENPVSSKPAEVKKPSINNVGKKSEILKARNNSRTEQVISRKYISQDVETNSKRVEVLVHSLGRLLGSIQEGVVSGAVLAKESLIGSAKGLRSRLLFQKGYEERLDGSQVNIAKRLGESEIVNQETIKEVVEKNTAVEETDRPVRLAKPEEVAKVLTPPDSPFTQSMPVVLEEVTEKVVTTPQTVEPGRQTIYTSQFINKPVAAEAQVESVNNIVYFPSRLLGLIGYIGEEIGETLEVLERRKLLLAA